MAEDVGKGSAAISDEIAPALEAIASLPLAAPPSGPVYERLTLSYLNGARVGPLALSVERDRDEIVVMFDQLKLFAAGKNYVEALDNLAERLDMLARQYLNTPEDKLTPSGIRLKESLRKLLAV